MDVSEPVIVDRLSVALSPIPEHFREALLREFGEAQWAIARNDWEKVGLKAGKVAEITYCILEGLCTGTYATQVSKPPDMVAACQRLERTALPGTPRSVRIQIPRLLIAVYELRNNRSIGHAGGDVDPNHMDGLLFERALKWIMAELVRITSDVPLAEAADLVEQVSTVSNSAVWQLGDRKRVLVDGLDLKGQTLVLLYSSDGRATVAELRSWLDVSNITNYKDRQLVPLHREGMIDFDQANGRVHLLPGGTKLVEQRYLRLLSK